MDNIGNFDKRIEIYELIEKEGRLGQNTYKLKLKLSRWAEIRPIKDKEIIVTYKNQNDVKNKFVIRYDRETKSINEKMCIKYNGNIYEINSVIDINMRHTFIEILATLKVDKEYEFETGN